MVRCAERGGGGSSYLCVAPWYNEVSHGERPKPRNREVQAALAGSTCLQASCLHDLTPVPTQLSQPITKMPMPERKSSSNTAQDGACQQGEAWKCHAAQQYD